MPVQLDIILALAILNGVAYRMGGSGNYPRFIRTLSIGLMVVISLIVIGGIKWNLPYFCGLLASGGLSAGLSTTYFKKKGSDAKWWNWAIVGLALSFAILPYAYVSHEWLDFILRSIVLTISITLSSEFIGLDILEEFMRGFLIIATLGILLI